MTRYGPSTPAWRRWPSAARVASVGGPTDPPADTDAAPDE